MSIENLQEVGANFVIATGEIRGKERFVKKAIKTAAFLAGATVFTLLPVQPVSADGAEVNRYFVELYGIDNPCTSKVENLRFSGSMRVVNIPNGTRLVSVDMKSDGGILKEMFLPRQLPNGNTLFRESLITPGGIANAFFNGEIRSDGSFDTWTLTCQGSQK